MLKSLFANLTGNICPVCKSAWEGDLYSCPKCHYEPKVIVCPKCFSMAYPLLHLKNMNRRQQYLTDPSSISPDIIGGKCCCCGIPYVELDITNIGFEELEKTLQPENVSSFIFGTYNAFRYIFENLFDQSQLDRDNYYFKKLYANMYPETEESKQFFKKNYNKTYEEYYFPKEQAEPPRNVPKCPICGSHVLIKISKVSKVAKVATFGIYGMGDAGKTYQCHNCKVKF